MSELKHAVNEVIRLYRKYYRTSDTDLLQTGLKLLKDVEKLDKKVSSVLDDSTMFYLTNTCLVLTYKQIYQIIDIACGTSLATEEDDE